MGGAYYDREVSTTNTIVTDDVGEEQEITRAFSGEAEKMRGRTQLHPDMDPYGKDIATESMSPVVLALDVTGSMGDWPLIIWDKLPMFYGQIMMNEYLDDPHMCFAPVGDAWSDKAPVQVTDFVVGMEMDDVLSQVFIEGGGGEGYCESYELMAFYFLKHCHLKEGSKPLLFFTADEDFYSKVFPDQVKRVIGDQVETELDSISVMRALGMKFNVYVLRKSYAYMDDKITKHWESALGPGRTLTLSNPKACVDTMLGIIAISGGTKDLDSYVEDMQERGQTEERIQEVRQALSGLNFELHEYSADVQDAIDNEIVSSKTFASYVSSFVSSVGNFFRTQSTN